MEYKALVLMKIFRITLYMSIFLLASYLLLNAHDTPWSKPTLSDIPHVDVSASVVILRSPENSINKGMGTGFQVKAPSGQVYTITNRHICMLQDHGMLEVYDKNNDNRSVFINILTMSDDADLCILEPIEGYPALTVADAEKPLGQHVWATGYPDVSHGKIHITDGITSSFRSLNTKTKAIETDYGVVCADPKARFNADISKLLWFSVKNYYCIRLLPAMSLTVDIHPGNSGSPLTDANGTVYGVVFATDMNTFKGEAVPLFYIKDLLKNL